MIKEKLRNLYSQLTDNSRGSFRARRIIYTGLSSFGSKAVTLLVTLISVPLTYNYLGEERFGMMMTILSVMAMLNFADMGLGLGLTNRLAEFEQSEDEKALKKAVSSTFFFLVGIACFFLFLFLFVTQYVEWNQIFNVKTDLAIQEANTAILVFAICFIVSLPFSIIQKVQGGFQEGYYNNFWEAGGNIFGLLFIVLFYYQKLGVPYFILAIYGSRVLFLMLNFFYQFLFVRKELIPNFRYIEKDIVKIILKDGFFFFILQFFAMLINTSDSVIIAYYLGAEAVAIYAIGYRLFSIFMMPVQAFIAPTWPAYNDAFAQGDMVWLRKTTQKLFKIVVWSSILLGLMYSFLGNFIVSIWINETTKLSVALLIAFSVYVFYFNINGFIFTILSTSKYLNYLILIYPLAAIFVLVLKVGLIGYYGTVASVLWATIIGCTVLFFIPGFFKLKEEGLIK